MSQLTVETIDGMLETMSDEQSELDLRSVRFADPYAVLMLDLLIAARDEAGRSLRILQPESARMRSWLSEMGLRGRGAPRPASQTMDNALQPITHIEDEAGVGRVVEGFHCRLAERYPLTETSRRALIAVLIELFQNIPHHSNATGTVNDPHGVAAMQDYDTSIFVAIADKGVGLSASLGLRDGYEGLSDADALDLVFHRGVSRFADPGRGGELRRIAELVRAWDGTFALRTGRALYYFNPHGGDTYDVPQFPGVQLALRLPMRAFLA
jgi:hypothetical protein